MLIFFDVLSRLPLGSIFTCKLVCKKFLRILKDPYFAEIHLTKTPPQVNITLQRCRTHRFCLSFFTIHPERYFDMVSSSSSTDAQIGLQTIRSHPPRPLTKQNEICFAKDMLATIVGECRGMICLYHHLLPVYCIRNPIIHDFFVFHYQPRPTPAHSYLDLSGFGYCPRTKVYKVIRFTSMSSQDPMTSLSEAEIEIHTVGSHTWRRVYGAPYPNIQGSFDPYLSGFYHFLTTSSKPSELICSLDLETESFGFIQPPQHFTPGYTNKISWINVGTNRGCLCLCYVFDHSSFEVWVMKEYRDQESWRKEFSINLKLYAEAMEKELQQPLKFMANGDMWFHSSSKKVGCYKPESGNFRIFESLGALTSNLIVYNPSFISPTLLWK